MNCSDCKYSFWENLTNNKIIIILHVKKYTDLRIVAKMKYKVTYFKFQKFPSCHTLALLCKSWHIGTDPDAGKDWVQEEKRVTEVEMLRRHHWLNVHEFKQNLGDSGGQGRQTGCSRVTKSWTQLSDWTCLHAKLLQSCPTLCNSMGCSTPGSSVPGDYPGKNTGVDCCALLQGIFATQGSSQPRDQTCVSYISCIGRWVLYH